MKPQEPGTAFENISQRVVTSYRRQLSEFVPVVPEGLPPGERRDMEVSERELGAFFRAFYECAYDHPERLGLPLTEDVCRDRGDGKEAKQDKSRKYTQPRTKMAHGIEFLTLVGRQGVLAGRHLRLATKDHAAFFAKSPRVKHRFVKGMEAVGLIVSEQDGAMVVGNTHYPNMMQALKALAEACAQRVDDRESRFLFARCDLRALDMDYRPAPLDLLRTAASAAEFEQIVELDRVLQEMAYLPALDIGNVSSWRVQYQGKRAIKSTPLLDVEYDERQRRQLVVRVKCASTNRLVPHLPQQPALLQEDFFRHANTCGGSSCGWCKTRKGMGPSVLRYGGERKTICWYMQRRFSGVSDEAVNLLRHYVLLHEALLSA